MICLNCVSQPSLDLVFRRPSCFIVLPDSESREHPLTRRGWADRKIGEGCGHDVQFDEDAKRNSGHKEGQMHAVCPEVCDPASLRRAAHQWEAHAQHNSE
eukprot:421809-Rhodomonas_salina.2